MKKFKSAIIILVACSTLYSFSVLHKFYLSLNLIEVDESSKHLEIALKFFVDDLEAGVKSQTGVDTYLSTPKEIENADDLVQKYIITHFWGLTGSEKLTIKYIGKEYEDDLCWVYIESSAINPSLPLTIHNTSVCDVYKEQQNIVQLKYKDLKLSAILDETHPEHTFKLQE